MSSIFNKLNKITTIYRYIGVIFNLDTIYCNISGKILIKRYQKIFDWYYLRTGLSQIILKQITYQIFSYSHISLLITSLLNPDCAVGIVARRRKPLRNAQLERLWPAGIFINMSRTKIVKSRLGGIAWIFKPQQMPTAQSGLKTVKIGLEQLLKCLSKKIRQKWFNLQEFRGRGNLFPLKATFLISHLYPIRIFATNRSGSKKQHFSL